MKGFKELSPASAHSSRLCLIIKKRLFASVEELVRPPNNIARRGSKSNLLLEEDFVHNSELFLRINKLFVVIKSLVFTMKCRDAVNWISWLYFSYVH